MKHKFFIIAISLLGVGAEAHADIAVVVHPKNNSTLDGDQIKNIFLGKKSVFPDDLPAKPIDQTEGLTIRNEFYQKIAHKSENDMKLYWSNVIFTGYGIPPKSFPNDDDVKKFVAGTPGAIGYIDSKSLDASVKSVFTIK